MPAKIRRSDREALIQAQFVALAGKSKRARLMADVEAFKAVPTIFTSFNRASMLGGAPLSCVWLVHGPSAGGKTGLTVGLIKSVQNAGGLPVFIDAEHSADTERWFRMLGVDLKRCLYIGRTSAGEKKIPLTYEEIVDEVDGVMERYQEGKQKGTIAPGTPLLIVVDSISKMVPERLLTQLSKEGGDALKAGTGRLQAMMNTSWLLSLGPRVGDDDIIFACIAHEMDSQDSSPWTPDFKVRGGQAIVYDSMMQVRVTYAGRVMDHAAPKGGKPVQVGKRHRVLVLKNKVGPAYEEAIFYTSNGKGLCPMGFDNSREVVREAILRGVAGGPGGRGGPELLAGSEITWRGRDFKMANFYQADTDATAALAEMRAELDRTAIETKVEVTGDDGDAAEEAFSEET